jgi:thioredoxin 1
MIRDVTEALFNDMLKKSDKVIVVEFWSPGCSVCRDVAPIYLQVSDEMQKEANFVRINTDANTQMAVRNGVTGTPTFMIFCRDGKVGEIIGMTSQTMLRNTIRDAIKYKVSCPGKKISYEMDGYG